MKIRVIAPAFADTVVPPLTLQVTFETEGEMRAYVTLVGPIPDRLNVIYPAFRAINAHLDKYSSKGA